METVRVILVHRNNLEKILATTPSCLMPEVYKLFEKKRNTKLYFCPDDVYHFETPGSEMTNGYSLLTERFMRAVFDIPQAPDYAEFFQITRKPGL